MRVRVGKIRNFGPVLAVSQKRGRWTQSCCWSLTESRTRAFDWFRNQRPWMTLNGHYALCFKMFFEAHHENLNQDRSIQSAAKYIPMTLVSGNLMFIQTFTGIAWRWGIKRQWGCGKRQFSLLSVVMQLDIILCMIAQVKINAA